MEKPMTTHELTSLFNPKTVAIVGASATPGKIGSRIVENLVNGGYPGTIYPVNPRGGEIAGVEVVRSIADIPEQIDVAYVIVPAAAAVTATRELAQAGARNVIVAASQFGESGTTEGIAHENGLREIARSTGTRIVGPNCNGIYSATHRASIGFNTAHAQVHRTGGVAIVSHSGAVFSTIMGRAAAEGMGLSAFVSVGNECDLDVLDYIAHFVTDPDTRCIALIIDSIPDGARFASLVRQAHDGGKTSRSSSEQPTWARPQRLPTRAVSPAWPRRTLPS
jgi:acetyltransferase